MSNLTINATHNMSKQEMETLAHIKHVLNNDEQGVAIALHYLAYLTDDFAHDIVNDFLNSVVVQSRKFQNTLTNKQTRAIRRALLGDKESRLIAVGFHRRYGLGVYTHWSHVKEIFKFPEDALNISFPVEDEKVEVAQENLRELHYAKNPYYGILS